MPVPCPHIGKLYYDARGQGPFCSHCDEIVWRRPVQRHAAPVKTGRLASLLSGASWCVLVVLAWCSLVQEWLWRPVDRRTYLYWWCIAMALWSSWTVSLALNLAYDPITWLDWLVFEVKLTGWTAVDTLLLMWWARILPRRSSDSEVAAGGRNRRANQ